MCLLLTLYLVITNISNAAKSKFEVLAQLQVSNLPACQYIFFHIRYSQPSTGSSTIYTCKLVIGAAAFEFVWLLRIRGKIE
jgi:hypothetical protein